MEEDDFKLGITKSGWNRTTRRARDRIQVYHWLCAKKLLEMALPPSLRVSVTPPELELIACQSLVEIIPLISMERTAFIGVCEVLYAT